MYINLLLIPFVLILGLVLLHKDSPRTRSLYLIITFAAFLFVAAMRNPEMMTAIYNIDSEVYQYNFYEISEMDWGQIWDTFMLRYVIGEGESDIGYRFFVKLISYITDEFYMFSLIGDLVFFIPLGIILYRYTTRLEQLIFACVFYVALIQIYLIAGGRQMFAIGFDLVALLFLLRRYYLPTVICFAIGLTIHLSSLLFAMPLVMIILNFKAKALKTFHLISLLLVPLVLAFPNQIIGWMGDLAGLEKYAKYSEGEIQGGANFFIILIEFISLFVLIGLNRYHLEEHKTYRIFYVMMPFITFFTPLITSNGTMIRITLYYFIFLTLLIPYTLDSAFSRSRQGAYIFAIAALSFLAIRGGGLRYYFLWQN